MFSHNPNATPIWLLIIFSAVSCFGTPQIKKYVSKHVTDEEKQNFYTSILSRLRINNKSRVGLSRTSVNYEVSDLREQPGARSKNKPHRKKITANSVKILDSQHLLRVFIFIDCIFAN